MATKSMISLLKLLDRQQTQHQNLLRSGANDGAGGKRAERLNNKGERPWPRKRRKRESSGACSG